MAWGRLAQLGERHVYTVDVGSSSLSSPTIPFSGFLPFFRGARGEVRVVGFGTFSTAQRKATTGRNPRTGEAIQIPASTQPKFKAGKGLKDAVNY